MEMSTTQSGEEEGVSAANSRFVSVNDDLILDSQMRIMWLKKDTWQICGKWLNWVQARDYAVELNRKKYAGYNNWRLPTALEARSLFDKLQKNKDSLGEVVFHNTLFPPGFGFLCWTSDVRNKIQAVRFGYRKGASMYDDIYRVSRGASRFVRDIDEVE